MFQLHEMTFALPSILEAILNPNLKNPGKSGSVRFLRGMKLGNNRGHQDKREFKQIATATSTKAAGS